MSDQNVKAAQKYLNAMFGGHKDWVKLDEDGKTGTAVMQGIIRAFQIQNGISTITGTVGPLTINTMKKLAIITKMDPNDTPQVNVCLIQCALFCKGYAAGGITGIYYTSGVNAVKKMQENAGLEVTGKIDWKVWSGLLSLNWFTKVSGGDSNIVLIQQQLNSDWSDVIGVGPCDGIASRQTILSLVGALQAAEGVTTELITDLNSVNFGDATTNAFPGTLQNGQNSTKYVPFNKIAQYGLYFNGYNPGRFDGVFDSTTESKVSEFQEFYGLTGIGLVTKGKVNVSTMKSLLTSKGDTNRAGAIDISTKISTSLESSTGKIYNIKVDIGNDGELTQTCKNQIMEISSNLSDTGIEGADNFGNTIEKIALSVKSGNIAFEINNVFANSVEFSIVFSTSDLLPEEEKEWTISVALIFTMTLNSNSGLEFNVVEFTKEHSNILAGAVILVLAGALVVNAIPSIIALFSAGAGTVFGLLIQAL